MAISVAALDICRYGKEENGCGILLFGFRKPNLDAEIATTSVCTGLAMTMQGMLAYWFISNLPSDPASGD